MKKDHRKDGKEGPKKHTARRTVPTREVTGTIRITSSGIGYLDDPGAQTKRSIEIDPNFLHTALHGDTVLVFITSARRDGSAMGEVAKIIKRFRTRFVGVLEKKNDLFYLVPDDSRMYRDILIPEKFRNGAEGGEKVLARILEWDDPLRDPVGEILRVIGKPGVHDVEMASIVYEKNFEIDFPNEVLDEADTLKGPEGGDEPKRGRKDLRSIRTATIDPENAKDFDDALSVRRLDNGTLEVGVHIADVSHYVTPGTSLNLEARRRGTSIYLVDRTIPMLPERLSNDLCSLNPNEDKFAFSAMFTLDKHMHVIHEWFGKTIIRSDKRFSYESAQECIDSGEGEWYEELNLLSTIAKALRERRMKSGALTFEDLELKITLGPDNRPVDISRKARLNTHKLIEEFMLLANHRTADFIARKRGHDGRESTSPFIYRVHPSPNQQKLDDLFEFLHALGYRRAHGESGRHVLNDLIKKAAGKPEEALVQTAMIQTMERAFYTTENKGHFGLALPTYTHFTSPIRRYPDLIVHRLLLRYLTGELVPPSESEECEAISRECSELERRAQEAERESIKYKQVEFMEGYGGETFDGIISRVTPWGFFVQEKKTLAEGMVSFKDLPDDYYIFDEKKLAVTGTRHKRVYRLGDAIRVRIKRTNLERRQIDYVLATQNTPAN